VGEPADGVIAEPLVDREEALAWLRRERAVLTAMIGAAEHLEEVLGPDHELRPTLDVALSAAAKAAALTGQLLAFARKRIIEPQPLNLNSLLEDMDRLLRRIIGEDVELQVRRAATLGYVRADAGQIEQVLINILDNACKFTPKDGLIEIRGYPFFWERRGGHAASQLMNDRRRAMQGIANSYRMDFRDSGLAIAQEHLDCIFEEYTSYSSGRDRSGCGLGSAICQSIIDQHEGRVWAENTSVGPMISFVLPLRRSIPHLDNTVDAEKHFETCSGR
jgi:signal transduction histidine kinase